ncbi:hypothetical protein RND81_10G036200 [Saponaria officinalis]|uniref:Uncharacterized protein n=1 Tax=Saponaria officinalis TaxID=3572 RepID=A0AAW1I010_SAPOF
MAAVWLDIHYKGKDFDYPIYDVDLIQILDLIDELGNVAMTQGLLVPNVYDLFYKTKQGNKMYIRSDMDLLGMFVNLEGLTTIEVWMEDTINPIKEFEIVAELRRVREENELRKLMEEDKGSRLEREREAENAQPLVSEIPSGDLVDNELAYVRVYESQEVQAEASSTPQTQTQPTPSHQHT